MAKNETADGAAAATPEAVPVNVPAGVPVGVPAGMPALGAQASVVVAQGLLLTNNETGQHFAPGVATTVTVNITTLRRLQDGDLLLA